MTDKQACTAAMPGLGTSGRAQYKSAPQLRLWPVSLPARMLRGPLHQSPTTVVAPGEGEQTQAQVCQRRAQLPPPPPPPTNTTIGSL